MKGFTTIIVLFFVSFTHGGDTQNFQEDISAFFNAWLKGDVQNFTVPLPSLDVITLSNLEGSHKEFGITLSYYTSELKLTGLPNSYFNELIATQSETALTVRGTLVAPSLMLIADKYVLDGRAYYLYPLKGAGEMRVHFRNAVLLFDIELGTNGKSMWVDKLQFGIDVAEMKVDLTGTSSIIANNVNGAASTVFVEHRADMEAAMREAVLPVMTAYLAEKAPQQFLADISRVAQQQLAL